MFNGTVGMISINCSLLDDKGVCRVIEKACCDVPSDICKGCQRAFNLGKDYELERIGTDVIQMKEPLQEDQLEELRTLLRGTQALLRVAEATKIGYWEYGSWEDGRWVKGNTRCRCSNCLRDFAVDNSNIWNCCPHCMSINSAERRE